MKIFHLDVETTGLYSWKHDIIQMAFIIEVNDETVEEENWMIKPHKWENIDDRAMQINGIDLDELRKTGMDPVGARRKLEQILLKHISPYKKGDKLTTHAYNAQFDTGFLADWWKKGRTPTDKHYGNYFARNQVIDPYQVMQFLNWSFELGLKSLTLANICKLFQIKIDAHDAMSDIKASMELLYKLDKIVKGKEDIRDYIKEAIAAQEQHST